MQELKLDSKPADKNNEIIIVEVSGYVDQSNSHELQKLFDDILESSVYKVIVDFSDLFYMSSAGWGIFVGEVKRFRDHGGDIRLAAMRPDIYDVYQMLEFYHILDDFNTVLEAAHSFDENLTHLDLMEEDKNDMDNVIKNAQIPEKADEIVEIDSEKREDAAYEEDKVAETPPDATTDTEANNEPEIDLVPQKLEHTIKLSQLPLQAKIRRVVADNPMLGLIGIRRALSNDHFGNVKIGWFRLWYLMKELDLNSKAKRYRFYRSC